MSLKTLRLLNLISLIILLLTDLFLGIFLFKFNVSFYYCTIFFVIGTTFLNYGFIILGYYKVKGYDMKPYTLALHSSYLLIAVAAYYLIRHIGNYDEFAYLYWIIPTILIIGFIIFFIILDKKKEKKNKNKPKFKANV